MLNEVEDYRINKLEELIRCYNKDNIEDSIVNYELYLNIRDVRDRYLGRNNSIFPYGLKGFMLSFKTINEGVYTSEAINRYFRKIE